MSRLWDLDDLVTVSDLAAEFGVGRAAVCNWAVRYDDFPEALTTVSCGYAALYSLRAVCTWHDDRHWQTNAIRRTQRRGQVA